MIFLAATTEPTMFLLLTPKDLQTMREGRTLFVDERATKGSHFTKVILSFCTSEAAAIEMLRQAGKTVNTDLSIHEQMPPEGRCEGCAGLMPATTLFEGRCIVCWAQHAKQRGAQIN